MQKQIYRKMKVHSLKLNLIFISIICSFIPELSQAQNPGWQIDESAYEYDMSMYISLQLDGKPIYRWDDVVIAAFCGTVCRGIAVVQQVNDKMYYYLRVRSNVTSGEKIVFKYYNKVSGREDFLKDNIDFVSLKQFGYPSSTYVLTMPIISVSEVSLNKDKQILLVTEKDTLIANILPIDATNKSITWSSNDESVATVSQDGVVTAIKAGTSNIVVTTVDGKHTASCIFTVIQPVTGISLDKMSLILNISQKETLIAIILPSDASNKNVKWSSSNELVATVSQEGIVTALNAGSVTITAITEDGGFKAECTVIIKKSTPVIIWNNPGDIVYGMVLCETQLSAKTDIDGTFIYTPALGTKLSVGNNQVLKVEFTPTDALNYESEDKTLIINVKKATPVITWQNPTDIIFGTVLSETQLNATSDIDGTFTYTPVMGTKLNVGSSQLKVDFTPADASNYENVSKTVSVTVVPAVLSVSTEIINISASANSSMSLDIISNTSWTASSNKTWLTVSAESGLNNGSVLLTATANMDNERAAIVSVISAYATSKIITVTQAAGLATGVESGKDENIDIYPNPISDVFSIRGFKGVAILKIFDLNNRILMSVLIKNNERISVHSLPPGMYIVKLITSDGTMERKIIKN